ncbi:hemagglutinin repeat-containing protein, partial [Glaciimonas sp. GG7]
GRDIHVSGSNIVGTKDVALDAKNNVTIAAAQNTSSSHSARQEKKSGITGSGGIGFSIGSQSGKSTADANQVTQSDARSTVGTSSGNLSITAGKDVHVGGSDLIAGRAADDTINKTGNIGIQAQNIRIDTGTDTAQDAATQQARQSGIGIALVGTPLDTVRNLQATGKNGGSNTQKAKAGLEEIGNSAGTLPQVAVTLGSSRSNSQSSSQSSTNSASSLQAAGNIQLVATGDGNKDSAGRASNGDITITGSNIAAGGNVLLDAQRDITVQAATDRYSEEHSASSKSSSLSLAINSPGDAARSMSGGPNNSGVTQSPYNASSSADNRNTQASGQRASSISGNSVVLNSHGGDIAIAGSGIVATNNVNLTAKSGQITVVAGQNTSTHHEDHRSHQIGDLGSSKNGTASTVGVRNTSDVIDSASQLQNPIRSQIISTKGSVTLDAKQDIHVQGSDLLAANNLTLIGQNLHLNPGQDASQSKETHRTSQFGITTAVGGVAGQLAQTANQGLAAQASGDNRVAALNAAKAGLIAANAIKQVA